MFSDKEERRGGKEREEAEQSTNPTVIRRVWTNNLILSVQEIGFSISVSLSLSFSFLLSPLVPRASTYERIPSLSVRFEARISRFFEIDSSIFFFFLHLSETRSCCDGFITMPTDKYWSKGNIGSKQVFQVVVIKKRGVGSKFFSTRFFYPFAC